MAWFNIKCKSERYLKMTKLIIKRDRFKEEMDKQVKIIRTKKVSWYTYAIDFPSKNVKSVVSGTLCDGKEITIVLVTKNEDYEKNMEYYLEMIGSFEC